MSWIDNLKFWKSGTSLNKNLTRNISPANVTKNSLIAHRLNTDERPSDVPDLMNQYQMGKGTLGSSVSVNELQLLAHYSDIIYMVHSKLKFEIFRNGFNIEPLFGETSLEEQKEKVYNLLAHANENKQTLKEVLEEIEDDLNTFDDAYVLVLKKYGINANKQIVAGELNEVLRVNPLSVKIVYDNLQRIGRDEQGKPLYFSIKDRSLTTDQPYDKKTGIQNLRACYKITGEDRDIYYDNTELLHVSKYKPSKLYGFSPLFSLYNKLITLINQDKYMKDYYSGDKAPKGILTASTTNKEALKAGFKEWREKTKNNPHGVFPILHEKATGDNGPIFEYINLMNNLNEMQYTATRDEIRRNISALYGVSPVFMNDVSTSGGLNNEGLQITVTNRASQHGQSIYNDKVLPFIFDQLGITQFEITLNSSEEEDQAFEKDLRLKELQIAKQTAELGLTVTMDEEGEFHYMEGKVELQSTQPDFIPFQNSLTTKSEEIKKPFADYKDFAECVRQNQDKENPEAYCGAIKARIENKSDVTKKASPEQEFKTALDKELESIIKQLDRKRKPSEQEFKKIVDKISEKFETQLKKKSSTRLKAIYEKAMKQAGKELNQEFSLMEKDKNVIEALKRSPVYQKAFSNVSNNVSERLKQVITEAYDNPKEFTIDKIVNSMKEELDKTDSELRTIARTETSKINIAARKTSYDKTGAVYKYKWIGPSDNRTSEISKAIKQRTNNGVSWEELVAIIEDESHKNNPKWEVNPLAPIPFPNTRHTFIAERVE